MLGVASEFKVATCFMWWNSENTPPNQIKVDWKQWKQYKKTEVKSQTFSVSNNRGFSQETLWKHKTWLPLKFKGSDFETFQFVLSSQKEFGWCKASCREKKDTLGFGSSTLQGISKRDENECHGLMPNLLRLGFGFAAETSQGKFITSLLWLSTASL